MFLFVCRSHTSARVNTLFGITSFSLREREKERQRVRERVIERDREREREIERERDKIGDCFRTW